MEPCIPTDNSLANPSIYTTVLHTLTCILVPVNLFGAYCILFKTPKKMNSVKLPMLNLHLLSAILDISACLLTVPYLLLPAMAGYPLGLLDAPRFQCYLIVSLLGAVAVAVVTLFENRYYVLFGKGTWWEKVRLPVIIFDQFMIPTFFLPIMYMIPDQQVAFQEITEVAPKLVPYHLIIFQFLPCSFPRFLNGREILIISLDWRPLLLSVASVSIWNTFRIILFFILILFKLILKPRTSLAISFKTMEMQKKFVIALFLQTSCILLVIFLPIFSAFGSLILRIRSQNLVNLMICLFSAHGIISTVITITVHHPYREFSYQCLEKLLFWKKPANRRSTISMSHFSGLQ